MARRLLQWSCLGAGVLMLATLSNACGEDCAVSNTCGNAIPTDGGTGETSTSDGPIEAPPGCDLTQEPKDAPACVDDAVGVFVDGTSGVDTNPGTKALPLKSLGGALAARGNKPRVYVCAGTYKESVRVTSPVELYGGFSCGTFAYAGTRTAVAPETPSYPLEIERVTGAVRIADLSFIAPNAAALGQSSIAAFVKESPGVLFSRAILEAGAAREGEDGAAGSEGVITAVTGGGGLNATGYPASGTTAGPIKTCTCSSGGTTSGAAGGGPSGAGALGAEPRGGAAPVDGAGGLASTSCVIVEPNGSGNVGADAPPASDAPKITALGTLDASGWTPQRGENGPNGLPGQGGGGGGGRDGAGGGGGCGGCGATGGRGGGGGGASVALASLESRVTLRASTLIAKVAARGGTGGAKAAGAMGGSGRSGGASGTLDGCPGGDGGRGGDSGAGGGGAGGVSVGVLYKGNAPLNEGSTLTPGTKGLKGQGGAAGINDGVDGFDGSTLEVP